MKITTDKKLQYNPQACILRRYVDLSTDQVKGHLYKPVGYAKPGSKASTIDPASTTPMA